MQAKAEKDVIKILHLDEDGTYTILIHPKHSRLITHSIFQRDIRDSLIKKIKKAGFSPLMAGEILLAEAPDGEILVVDGQHRVIGARVCEYNGLLHARIIPYTDGSKEDVIKKAALLFHQKNTVVANQTAFEKYASLLVGGDPVAALVQKVLKENKYTLTKPGKKTSTGRVSFTAELMVWAGRNPKIFRQAFAACVQIYRDPKTGEKLPMYVNTFKGVTYAAEQAKRMDGKNEKFLRPNNVKKLAKVGPVRVGQVVDYYAKGIIGGTTRTKPGTGIIELVNKGRRETTRFVL